MTDPVEADRPFSVVPSCAKCGAQGTPIGVDNVIPLRGAALLAVHEIQKHNTEMHPQKEYPMTATTFELVNPNELLLEDNVRTTVDLDEGFVRSIKENGVLTAVLAHRNPEGALVVRAGQRRTLAARKAGVATVPVQVVDGDEQTSTRIIEQMVENDQREDLTGPERVEAFKQLEFEGTASARSLSAPGRSPPR